MIEGLPIISADEMNNLEAIEKLQLLLNAAEVLEFPYCDIAHESPPSNTNGLIISRSNYEFECPKNIQLLRPACPHAKREREDREIEDPILALAQELIKCAHKRSDGTSIRIKCAQYNRDVQELLGLDFSIRHAREFAPLEMVYIQDINNTTSVKNVTAH